MVSRPTEWREVVDFDRIIRRKGGIRGDLYLHRKCVPINEVDFRTAEDLGQGCFDFAKTEKLSTFGNMEI